MSGAIPPFSQYTFMAWCSVKAQGQLYLYLYLYGSWGCLRIECWDAYWEVRKKAGSWITLCNEKRVIKYRRLRWAGQVERTERMRNAHTVRSENNKTIDHWWKWEGDSFLYIPCSDVVGYQSFRGPGRLYLPSPWRWRMQGHPKRSYSTMLQNRNCENLDNHMEGQNWNITVAGTHPSEFGQSHHYSMTSQWFAHFCESVRVPVKERETAQDLGNWLTCSVTCLATIHVFISLSNHLLCIMRNRGNSVSIVTRYQDEQPGFDSRRGRDLLFSSPRSDHCWGPPSLLSNKYRQLFPLG
jgi:hypothetical protein